MFLNNKNHLFIDFTKNKSIMIFKQALKHIVYICFIFINFACSELVDNQYKSKDLGGNTHPQKVICKYGCMLPNKDIKPPIGIENESNFCYLIALMHVLSTCERYYNIFKDRANTGDILAKRCFEMITKIRCQQKISKKEVRRIVKTLDKRGWLKENGRTRKWDDPRDPSRLLKFMFRCISNKYFAFTSIIKGKNLNNTSYCVDQGKGYDDIQIKCESKHFYTKDIETLAIVNVYNGDDLNHALTYKSYEITIPKSHANTTEDLVYKLSGFIQIKKNKCGGNHATAYMRDLATNEWYHVNDNKACLVNKKCILNFVREDATVLSIYFLKCNKKYNKSICDN